MSMTVSDVARQFFLERSDPEEEPLRSASIRMPVQVLHRIDSMASHAELSRNAMANQLLSVGIDAVLDELPDELRESIEVQVFARLEAESQPDGEDL